MEDLLDRDDRDDTEYSGEERISFEPFPHLTPERVQMMEKHLNEQTCGDETEDIEAAMEIIKGRTDMEILCIAKHAYENKCPTLTKLLPKASLNLRFKSTTHLLNAVTHGFGHEWLQMNAKKTKNAGIFNDFCAHKKMYLDVDAFYGDEIRCRLLKSGEIIKIADKTEILTFIGDHVKNSIPKMERGRLDCLTDDEYDRFAMSFAYLKRVEGGLVDDMRDYTSSEFMKENKIYLSPSQKRYFTRNFGAIVGKRKIETKDRSQQ